MRKKAEETEQEPVKTKEKNLERRKKLKNRARCCGKN